MISENSNGNGTLRVLAETAYPESTAASRVRIAAFAPFLRDHGVDLRLYPTLTDSEYALVSSSGFASQKSLALATAAARATLQPRPPHDLLLVQRLRFLSPIPRVDPPDQLDVYDFDDALFLGAEGALYQRWKWVKQEARRCVAYLRRTRLTIAGNSFLADTARAYASRVEVVPSCVDPSTQSLHTHADGDELVIGWIGSRSTSPYLREVLPAIQAVNSDKLRARLVLVGADSSITAPWIEHRPWSLETEANDLASFDVGIMPVPDNDWGRGKCGYKALQYFAAGVPAVVSPVGVARELIGEDRGLAATSSEEWKTAIETLLSDVEERRQRGEAARKFVELHYSYQRWAPEVAQLLASVDTDVQTLPRPRRVPLVASPAQPRTPTDRAKPKVLQLLAVDYNSGTENMVCSQVLARHPDRVSYEVAILDSPGPIAERLKRAGIPVHSLGPGDWMYQRRTLTELVQDAGFGIVNAYGFKATMLARAVVYQQVLTRPRRTLLICGVRGAHTADVADLGSAKARAVELAERLTRDAVDIWDANSPGGAEFVRRLGVPPDRIRYIPNGVDVELWPLRSVPPQVDPPQVICVSRFVACKRHVDLVRALGLLRDAGTQLELHLVGDGPTRPSVDRLVRELGLQQQVTFHGALDHRGILEVMRDASVFCLPSTWEGMPGAVMEAMASGLPVVGTRVNGISTLVVDGVSGRLVPPREPQQLAGVLGECLRDPESMLEMGRQGRRRIEEEFSVEAMVDRKEGLYAEAAELIAGAPVA